MRLLCAIAAVMALLLAGCEKPPTKSAVARGQLYTSGSARYDAIFQRIYAVQSQGVPTSEDRRAARKPLATLLGLGANTDDRTLLASLGKRAAAHGGQGFRLDVTATSGRCTPLVGTKPDIPLARAVEETVRAELERQKRLQGRVTDLNDLEREIDHAALDAKRSSTEDAGEIRRELNAGSASTKKVRVALQRVDDDTEEFLGALAYALAPNRARTRPTPGATPSAAPPPPPGGDTPRTIEPLPPPLPPPLPSPAPRAS